jgi:DNA-binding Lrp family transcriptional regulator
MGAIMAGTRMYLRPDPDNSWETPIMDRIDRQIVHCLQRDGRASFRRIAEVLDVSEQTVARRYRALHASGTVAVVVLPSARESWFVRIRCRPDAADALADALAAREDVSWVAVTAGGGELTCGAYTDPGSDHLLDRLPRTHQVLSFTGHAVLRIHAGGDAEWLAFDDPLTPAQLEQLGSSPARDGTPPRIRDDDAPLVAELARDGRAGVVALARATGWPPSRVSTRLDALLSSGAVHIEVDLAVRHFGFHAMAYVHLTVPPGELEATGHALSLHPETAFAAAVTGPANLLAVVNCRTTDDLYTYVTSKVGALPAVRQAEVVPVLRTVKQARSRLRSGRLELAPP